MKERAGQLWLFDMDGTLFRTEPVGVPAFHLTMRRMTESGIAMPTPMTDERITSTFGLTHDKIWDRLYDGRLSRAEQAAADAVLLEEEIQLIGQGVGQLYDSVIDTLDTLHREGASLAVASNGQQPYIEAIVRHFGIAGLFSGLYSASGAGVATKVDLVRLACAKIAHSTAVMVGDRYTDIEAGRANGLFTVGCAFGFGEREVADADVIVRTFPEILAIDTVAR